MGIVDLLRFFGSAQGTKRHKFPVMRTILSAGQPVEFWIPNERRFLLNLVCIPYEARLYLRFVTAP